MGNLIRKVKIKKGFMERKSVTGVYYNGKLQQTFNDFNDAENYIENELKDPNAERVKFSVKILPRY